MPDFSDSEETKEYMVNVASAVTLIGLAIMVALAMVGVGVRIMIWVGLGI